MAAEGGSEGVTPREQDSEPPSARVGEQTASRAPFSVRPARVYRETLFCWEDLVAFATRFPPCSDLVTADTSP